mgnify:FL=1
MNDMRSQFAKLGYGQASKPAGNRQGYNKNTAPAFVVTLNYDPVDAAEKVINYLEKDKYGNIALTTSQIRKFLTAVNVVRNKVDLYIAQNKYADELSIELAAEVKFLKVNLLYQAGRAKAVKDFMEISNLAAIISDVDKNIKKFQRLCKYVEALVAYHKFMGGKDK